MQAYHTFEFDKVKQISKNKKIIKKRQIPKTDKTKPNEYTKKDFHKNITKFYVQQ